MLGIAFVYFSNLHFLFHPSILQEDNLWEHKSVLSTTAQTFNSINEGLSSELENNVPHDQFIIHNEDSNKILLNDLVNSTENLKDYQANSQLKNEKKKDHLKHTFKPRHPRNKTTLNKKKKRSSSKRNKNPTQSLPILPASDSNQIEEVSLKTSQQASSTNQHSKSDGNVRRKRDTRGNAKFSKNRKKALSTISKNSNPNTDKSSNLCKKRYNRPKAKKSMQKKNATQLQRDTISQAESPASASK